MADDFPLSILDRRISSLRERIREMSNRVASREDAEQRGLRERISEANKELDELVAERSILSADAR
jgi:hypothetical protein